MRHLLILAVAAHLAVIVLHVVTVLAVLVVNVQPEIVQQVLLNVVHVSQETMVNHQ